MKRGTEICMGINHVGKADAEIEVGRFTCETAIKRIMEFMVTTSLATRFDIVIARTEEECLSRLKMRTNAGMGSRTAATESIDSELDRMFAELGLEVE